MNYYSFHVGDYASHTRHLTLLGDLAYRRLIDHYYLTERPLPSDPAECARLIGMRSNVDDVAEVLADFFTKTPAGWANKRCEQEINAFHCKEDAAKSRKAGETERQRRHRERRAELFEKLRELGVTPDFDTPTSALVTDLSRVTGALRHADTTAITKNQEPRTKNQDIPPISPKGDETGGQAAKPKPKAVTLKTFLAECGESGEAPIPEDDPVFAYAEKVGLPERFLHLAWGVFQSKYVNTSQRQSAGRGWRQKFRNAVEGNWGKLWYMNGSGWELTTAGKQAELAHGDES